MRALWYYLLEAYRTKSIWHCSIFVTLALAYISVPYLSYKEANYIVAGQKVSSMRLKFLREKNITASCWPYLTLLLIRDRLGVHQTHSWSVLAFLDLFAFDSSCISNLLICVFASVCKLLQSSELSWQFWTQMSVWISEQPCCSCFQNEGSAEFITSIRVIYDCHGFLFWFERRRKLTDSVLPAKRIQGCKFICLPVLCLCFIGSIDKPVIILSTHICL